MDSAQSFITFLDRMKNDSESNFIINFVQRNFLSNQFTIDREKVFRPPNNPDRLNRAFLNRTIAIL